MKHKKERLYYRIIKIKQASFMPLPLVEYQWAGPLLTLPINHEASFVLFEF